MPTATVVVVSAISVASIARINAAARLNGVSYSRLMGGLKKADVRLNRKMLAQLAVVDPGSFTNVVAAAKS